MSTKVKTISTTAVRSLLGHHLFNLRIKFLPAFSSNASAIRSPRAAEGFMGGLFQAGYFFPMVKGLEILLGGFLLLNFFTPLSLIILAPISLNIFLFHAFLSPGNIAVSILIVLLHIYLLWSYKNSYRTILDPKVLLS